STVAGKVRGGGGKYLNYNEAVDQIEFCDLEAVSSPQWQVQWFGPATSLALNEFRPARGDIHKVGYQQFLATSIERGYCEFASC
ncbi:MAG: hypothetical protein VXZ54_13905, partial [Planctomycetota bacterium]|nr:hypothetical protein [Planctomycetota bacterium]